MTETTMRTIRDYLEFRQDAAKRLMDHEDALTSYLLEYGFDQPYQRYDSGLYGPKRKCKECYGNAYMVALENGLDYVEGFADNGLWPMPHAWCLDADGKVVDPTWRDESDTDCGLCDEGQIEVCTEYDDDGDEVEWETVDCPHCKGSGEGSHERDVEPTYFGCVFDLDYVGKLVLSEGTWGVLDKLDYDNPQSPGDLR